MVEDLVSRGPALLDSAELAGTMRTIRAGLRKPVVVRVGLAGHQADSRAATAASSPGAVAAERSTSWPTEVAIRPARIALQRATEIGVAVHPATSSNLGARRAVGTGERTITPRDASPAREPRPTWGATLSGASEPWRFETQAQRENVARRPSVRSTWGASRIRSSVPHMRHEI